MRVKTGTVGRIAADVVEALRAFRAEHGRQWKAKLRELWFQGGDVGPLRIARNVIGPSGLDAVNLDEPTNHDDERHAEQWMESGERG